MVTPRTGRPRGRPKAFLRDPERFAIPYALALMSVYRASENAAFTAVAAELLVTKVGEKSVGPRRKRGRGAVPPGIQVTYRAGDDTPGWPQAYERGDSLAEFLENKASTLRKKARRVKAEHPEWYRAMTRAVELTFCPEKDQQLSALQIMSLATSVGEAGFAHSVLLPQLSAKFFRSPDLLPKVRPK